MIKYFLQCTQRDRHGRDRMVGEFTTACAISAHHHNVVISNPTQVRCIRYNIMW